MKKYFFIVLSFVFLLGFNNVSAFNITETPPIPYNQPITLTGGTVGNVYIVYRTDTNERAVGFDITNTSMVFDLSNTYLADPQPYNFRYVECNNIPQNEVCFNAPLYSNLQPTDIVDEKLFSYTPTPVIPERPATLGIIFPLEDEETGETGASLLTASAVLSTQKTMGNLTPIVAIVGGIIITFIFLRYMISLYYETTNKKENKKV